MTIEADNKTIERLAKWEHKNPQTLNYMKLYQKLLGLRIEDSYLPILEEYIAEIAPHFKESNSPLQFGDLLSHWEQLDKLFREASSIVDEHVPDATSGLERLIAQPPLLERIAESWYQNSLSQECAAEIDVDWAVLSLCLRAAFHPILISYSEVLSPLVEQDSWRGKLCPVCGGKPDLAFLGKETGSRWLVCSRCDTEWLFFRLECPFCGSQDQDSLAYLASENGLYRLYTCKQCQSYIKAIDLRCAQGNVLFPLERILTLDLDRQAYKAGYEPGWIALMQ